MCPPGLTHLQFEALLTTAKHSANRCDFALVTMLGLLGLRIFEATGMASGTLVKSTATACCACAARATRSCSSRSRLPWPRHRTSHRRAGHRPDPADLPQHPDGPALRHLVSAASLLRKPA